MVLFFFTTIEPFHKWLAIINSFVIIKISVDNSKEFLLPNEVSEANLNAYKRILDWQPFMKRVYRVYVRGNKCILGQLRLISARVVRQGLK